MFCLKRKQVNNLGGTDAQSLVDVRVGASNGVSKTVTIPANTVCPGTVNGANRTNTDYKGAPDTFKIVQNGTQLTATRTDSNSGWAMDLGMKCTQGPAVPVKFGPSGSVNKSVTVPNGVVCPATCGPNCRTNTDYAGYPDTFTLTPNGSTLTATRTDNNSGWAMDFGLNCVQGPPKPAVVPVKVGPSYNSGTKSVTVPYNTICPSVVGPNNRTNTDYAGAGDTFAITQSGNTLTATRTDANVGNWWMDLSMDCVQGPTVPVVVGPQYNNSATKTVTVPAGTVCRQKCGPGCRTNTDYATAPDTFAFSQTGNELTATRLDSTSGWWMNMGMDCVKGPSVPVTVGPSYSSGTKTVAAPAKGLICPASCGPNCRTNSDYANAPDTFKIDVTNSNVKATRTDSNVGNWWMNLGFDCTRGLAKN